jgi:transcriptional regulator with XRE-family HTH domain
MTHPTDEHVGQRLKNRRTVMGLTQSDVADHLGISFQQVQKYELGRNRISASKLHDIAQLLNVDIGYFFEGLDKPEPDTLAPQPAEDTEALTLFRRQTPDTRNAILRILNEAAKSQAA